MIDLVIPNKNEMELALCAKELGVTELVFLKDIKSFGEAKKYAEDLKGFSVKGIKLSLGRIIYVKKKSDLYRKDFDKLCSVRVAKSDGSEDANRVIFESDVNAVIGISSSGGREHTHYRQSGMNQVLAKLASDNGINYCLDFFRLLNLSINQRVLLLGRWMQNLRILRKYKAKTEIYSFATKTEEMRNPKDLEAFLKIL